MHDIKTNIKLQESHVAKSYTTGAQNGIAVDMSKYPSASFFISVGDKGAAGTLNAKLQMSDDGTTFVDEDGVTGNDTSITAMTANGAAQLNVLRPQRQYYRVLATVGTNAVAFGVTVAAGPARHTPV